VAEQETGDQLRKAREALAAARAEARAKGLRPAPTRRPPADDDLGSGNDQAQRSVIPRSSPGNTEFGKSASVSSAQPGIAAQQNRTDPQSLSQAIDALVAAEGWALAAATGSVFGRWDQIVGADMAAHTWPESLSGGELTVTADSTAWATQVRLLAAQLVRRLNSELGDGTVQRVKVRGPAPAPRQPGQWRVRGSRGPRDTYG